MNAVTVDGLSAREISAYRLRLLISGLFGSSVEWYDFFLYGFIGPTVFDKIFFAKGDPMVSLIAVWGVYAVGYLARPVGAFVFGHYGDRIGRKPVLYVTLALMGVATTLIGCLPTYAEVGVLAPILLLLCRMAQGFALSGEVSGITILTTESAPEGKRGGFTGIVQVGAAIGSFLGAGAVNLVANMDQGAMLSWGWRVPFVVSIVLVAIGLYVRAKVMESPIFARVVTERAPPERVPLLTMFKTDLKPFIIVLLSATAESSQLNFLSFIPLGYAAKVMGVSSGAMLTGLFWGNIAGMVTNPMWARISDFVGRRPVIIGGFVGAALFGGFLLFPMLATKDPFMVALAMAIPGILLNTAVFATEGSFYAELFSSARTRFSGAAVARGIGAMLGGFFPLIVSSIALALGNNPVTFSISFAILVVFAVGAILTARETNKAAI